MSWILSIFITFLVANVIGNRWFQKGPTCLTHRKYLVQLKVGTFLCKLDSETSLEALLGSLWTPFWNNFGDLGSTFGTLAPLLEVLEDLKKEVTFLGGSGVPPMSLGAAPGSPQGKGLGRV